MAMYITSDESGEERDAYDLLAESRFVSAQLRSALHTARVKRLYAALAAYLLVLLTIALIWPFFVPSHSRLLMGTLDLIPSLVLLCTYAAFEAVRYVLSLSAQYRDLDSLWEYQERVTRLAEAALREDETK